MFRKMNYSMMYSPGGENKPAQSVYKTKTKLKPHLLTAAGLPEAVRKTWRLWSSLFVWKNVTKLRQDQRGTSPTQKNTGRGGAVYTSRSETARQTGAW